MKIPKEITRFGERFEFPTTYNTGCCGSVICVAIEKERERERKRGSLAFYRLERD